MALDTDLYTYLTDLVDTAVEEGKISEEQPDSPRVWFNRSSANTEMYLDGSAALTTTGYDLEVQTLDIATAQSLSDTIKTALHGYAGLIGSTRAIAVFVNDQDDDYQPKLLDGDEGHFVAALRIQIIT